MWYGRRQRWRVLEIVEQIETRVSLANVTLKREQTSTCSSIAYVAFPRSKVKGGNYIKVLVKCCVPELALR
jgi:hypothetical protein